MSSVCWSSGSGRDTQFGQLGQSDCLGSSVWNDWLAWVGQVGLVRLGRSGWPGQFGFDGMADCFVYDDSRVTGKNVICRVILRSNWVKVSQNKK